MRPQSSNGSRTEHVVYERQCSRQRGEHLHKYFGALCPPSRFAVGRAEILQAKQRHSKHFRDALRHAVAVEDQAQKPGSSSLPPPLRAAHAVRGKLRADCGVSPTRGG